MSYRGCLIAISVLCFPAVVLAEPTKTQLPIDAGFGKSELADITSVAVFSSDSTHLFVAVQRQIQVFRCADGSLIQTVALPQTRVNNPTKLVRRLAIGLEGSHFCGRVLQGYQDVQYDAKLVPGGPFGFSKWTPHEPAVYQHKAQFHHPGYLRVVDGGARLLAGIAQREAYLLDIDKLISGANVTPERLFQLDPQTELSSFVAALNQDQFVFMREDVAIPETEIQNNAKPSDPAEQQTAGRLEVFDKRLGKFVPHSAIELENPFHKKLRKRFQVFTLFESEPHATSIKGIQLGCVWNNAPPKELNVPYRRFEVSWDDQGVGQATYGAPQILTAQPHLISPGLRHYVSTNDDGYLRGLASPRLGTLAPLDKPTKTKRYEAVARSYWVNETLHAVVFAR